MSTSRTPYDIVVDIPSIVAGGQPMGGWAVEVRQEFITSVLTIARSSLEREDSAILCEDGSTWLPLTRKEIDEISNTVARISENCCMLSVVGMFNRGKTFILNQLGDNSFPAGLTESTKGISARVSADGGVVFIDSAGNSSPIDASSIAATSQELSKKFDAEFFKKSNPIPHPGDDAAQSDINKWKDDEKKRRQELGSLLMNRCLITKQCTERFQEDVVFATSDVLLFVTNGLTYPDQILLAGIKLKAAESKCPLIVVHNFRDCESQDEFRKLKEGVASVTGAELMTESTGDGQTIEMISMEKEMHLFLGKADSPAGQDNVKTFSKIKDLVIAFKTYKPLSDCSSFLSLLQGKFFDNLHSHIRGEVLAVQLYANKHVLNQPNDATSDNILRMRIQTKFNPAVNPRLREGLSPQERDSAQHHLWLNKDIVGLDGSQIVFARADFTPKIDAMFLDLNKGQGPKDMVYKILVELPGFVGSDQTIEGYKPNNDLVLTSPPKDPSTLIIKGKRSKLHRVVTRSGGGLALADKAVDVYSPSNTEKGEIQTGAFERRIQIPLGYEHTRKMWKVGMANGVLEIIIPMRQAL